MQELFSIFINKSWNKNLLFLLFTILFIKKKQ